MDGRELKAEQEMIKRFEEALPELKTIPNEIKQMKIVNRMNDALFKYIFGRDENKAILVSFLNSILEPEGKHIVDLAYLDREASPKFDEGKGCRFDVRAKADDGRIFHVEVQISDDVDFFERCLFYACDSYANQLKSGDVYRELMPVIFIGVLGYELLGGKSVHSHYMLMETERHEVGTDAFEFHFFELPKLRHGEDFSGRKFYRWLRYLSSQKESGDEEMQELAQDTMIAEALRVEELFKTNPETRFRYMQSELEKYLSTKREAYFVAKGVAEGEAKGKLETARKLLEMGLDFETISKATGLTKAQLKTR